MLRILTILVMILLIPLAYAAFDVIGALMMLGLVLAASRAWFEDGSYVAAGVAILVLVFAAGLVGEIQSH